MEANHNRNIIYVEQSQCVITNKPDTFLITTGMTECIGMTIQSIKYPSLQALAHFDGNRLGTVDQSIENVRSIKKQLNDIRRDDFLQITAFGGRDGGRNQLNLHAAIYNVFNKDRIKYRYYSVDGYNPLHGDLTIATGGHHGTFEDVAKTCNINKSIVEIEDMDISERLSDNNKIVIIKNVANRSIGF